MKILLAIDGSSYSDAALRKVAQYPWPQDSEVRVITVDAPLTGSILGGGPASSAYDDLVNRQRHEAQTTLDKAMATLKRLAPSLLISSAFLEGSPKEEINAEARRWKADLIVVGSHGRGAISSLLLGSVSLSIVCHAPCSVMVIRPEP